MQKQLLTLISFFFPLCGMIAYAQNITKEDVEKYYAQLPVEIEVPQLPIIAETRIDIQSFGAKGDGVTLCTEAFQKAISYLSQNGGGHLIVPQGVWLTGPIVLNSGIDLHVDRGAIISFTPDKSVYVPEGGIKSRVLSCITADKCNDISITGEGILDGNGKYWRYAKREKLSDSEWKDLKTLGGTVQDDKLWFPYNLKNVNNVTATPEAEEAVRAHMLSFKRCTRLLISGVTIQNSPKFHINPSICSDVIIKGVTVRCPWNAQNGDGIDIGNSKRVLVAECVVDVGDDAICMKGGSGTSGLQNGPCRDILICDNTVFHGHGGFVIGSDISGGMQKIIVKNCTFSGTDTGLRFKSSLDRGGKTKDIFISNITMNDIRDAAITFSCDYENVTYKSTANKTEVDFVPDFSDIHISDVVCRETQTAIHASGIEGFNCVHDITISNSTFFFTKKGTDVDEKTTSIELKNVNLVTF